MSNNKNELRRQKTTRLVVLAMLTAILLVMTFTPLGYLRIGPLGLEITLMMVPVIIGAIVEGPAVGAFLGLVFGLSSFAQCFMGSPLGMILVARNIPFTFLVCVVSRTLAGWLCGLIFKVCKQKIKKEGWAYAIASICGSALNTILFLGMLALFFFNVQFTAEEAATMGVDNVLGMVILIAAGINAPIELLVCSILGSAIGKAIQSAFKRIK